jgi:hypothetical protein
LQISCGGEVVCGFCGRVSVDDAANGIPETVDGAFGSLSEICFEFGEGVLDGIEVGAAVEDDCWSIFVL